MKRQLLPENPGEGAVSRLRGRSHFGVAKARPRRLADRPTGSYRYSVVLARNVGVFILLRKSTGSKKLAEDQGGPKIHE